MVYKMQLTCVETIDKLNLKNIPSKRIVYSLQPKNYKFGDLNKWLENNLPNNVKVTIAIDDITLKSNLKNNQTLIFKKKSFFYTILGFTQSYWGVICDFEELIQFNL